MKGTRAVVMLLLSLVAGLAAVVLAARWLNERSEAASSAPRWSWPARDLDLGQPSERARWLRLVPWPAGAVPAGSFDKVEALEGTGAARPDV